MDDDRAGSPTELTVIGVRVELPTQQPVVLLREEAGHRYLPIYIGAVEATAIAFAQQGIFTQRPMTHDLLKDVLDALGRPLVGVTISALRDNIFYAELDLGDGVRVSARSSDAIALAMRAGCAIHAADAVMEEAGVAIPDEQEDEVERFREFLDTISPEDFTSTPDP